MRNRDLRLNERFNPLKGFTKLPSGSKNSKALADEDGNLYIPERSGYSDILKIKGSSFRYNFRDRELEWIDGSKVVDSRGLSAESWFKDPEFWAGVYYDEIQEELKYLI